jgi:hypothetical protein
MAKTGPRAEFDRRRGVVFQTGQCRQRLFVPTVLDARRAFDALFFHVTGLKDTTALTETGDGMASWRERVDMNEYEEGVTLLLPGDVMLFYSWRDDIVAPPACEISLTASTREVADATRAQLSAIGAPLLPLVISTQERLPPPELRERWDSRDWWCLVSSTKNSSSSTYLTHQIYVPIHDVGPPMGRETDYELDFPELGALISSLRGEPPSITTCDFRFATREDFDRVRALLLERLLARA